MKRSPSSRTARVFLSSTFRDFGEERDLLVRKVFPGLRARLKDRFVELVDVDLRWGITAEQAERGEVLPICLSEIDRSRPFFVGLLGERYGWVPEKGKYPPELVEQRPWLKKHQGGKSVTELEILHGVLNNPKMAGRALFYFRSSTYAKQKGGDYLPQSPEDRERQRDLKARIRESGFPVVQGYKDPEALAKRLEKDLWKILDEMYPADDVPDAFSREGFRHEAYAVPRRRLYLGGEGYIEALDNALAEGRQRVLVEGASGGGKSALIANWLEKRGRRHRKELVHVHYLGATAEASDPQALVRRLIEAIKRLTESTEEIPSDPQAIYDSLSTWLAIAHAYAGKRKTKFLIVLDALNGLRDLQDLRWFPEFLPERVRMVVSCLPGQVHEALLTKGDWHRVEVTPLDSLQAEDLFVAYLRRYNKELPADLLTLALNHPLSTNPPFLRTLAEELRLFGVHEQLKDRLDHYLTSKTVDDLFERVLERVEQDCGAKQVRKAMEGIWASRAGLSEHEIQGFANLKPAEWAPIRHALDDSLLESGGRITFAHDYMRLAVSDRYLAGNNTLPDEGQSPEAIKLRKRAHIALAKWFDTRPEEEKATKGARGKSSRARKPSVPKPSPADARSAEEVPWQYQQAKDWRSLKACLTRRDMFEAIYAKRSNEELLAYWLDIEANTRARIEREYEKAWSAWKPNKTEEATGGLAHSLSRYLKEAGRSSTGEVASKLAKLAVRVAENAKGSNAATTASYLGHLAEIMREKADYSGAERILRRILLIRQKAHHRDPLSTSECLHDLAHVMSEKGGHLEAERLYLAALKIRKNILGPQHSDVATSLNNLSDLYREKGRYGDAEEIQRQALSIREKVFGPDHPVTISSVNNLAMVLRDMGDENGAEQLQRRALKAVEKWCGPDHPNTGTAINNLALLLQSRGDYENAEHLLRRALLISEKTQGADHPDTSDRLSNLALMLIEKKGATEAAELLLRRALAIKERKLGPMHPDTGSLLNNLGFFFNEVGDYEAAEPLYRRALAIAEENYGPQHPDTSAALNNLGSLLREMGHYEPAETLLQRAIAIDEDKYGLEHPKTSISLNNLVILLEHKGDYGAAEPLLRRVLAITEAERGPEHPGTGRHLSNLAVILLKIGNYEAAEPLFRRALDISEKTSGMEHPETGSRLNNLARLLQMRGDYAAAEPLFRRALSIAEVAQGLEHPATCEALNNLAWLLQDIGDYDRADPLLRRALAIEIAELGPEHKDVMRRHLHLAHVLRCAGRSQEAEKELLRAVQIAEKLDLGGPFFDFAELCIDQKRYEEAGQLLQRCLEIRRRKLDPGDEAIGEAIRKLAEVYRLMGREGDAVEVEKQLMAPDAGKASS